MKARASIVRRLTVALVVVVVAMSALAALAGSVTIHREINEAMDGALVQTARRLLPLVVDTVFARGPEAGIKGLSGSLSVDDDDAVVFQVRDATGRVLLRSHEAPETPLTPAVVAGFADESGWRVYTQATVSDTLFVQVAERGARRDEETLEAALGILVPLGVLAPLAALAAWLVVRRLAAPIEAFRTEIARRSGDDLAPIRTAGMPVELAGIAGSVNLLLRRLGLALDAEREFSGNAAHELRTPLAGALSQTQRLIDETSDPASRRRAEQIEEALRKLAHLAEKLLQLSRADAGIGASGSSVDLGLVVALVVEDLRRSGVVGAVDLSKPERGPFVIFDQDGLGIVIRNLVENASIHGAPPGTVSVVVEESGRLRVQNPAAPVPAEELQALRERFKRRGTEARGSGLGLAIVQRLAEAGGAELALASRRAENRFVFEATVSFRPAL